MTNISVEIKKNLLTTKEKARLEYYKKLADRLVDEFKPVTLRELDEIRCSPTGDLAPFGETFLSTRLQELMGDRYTPSASKAIIHHVMASTYTSIYHIKSPYHIIPVANGNLDVITGKLYDLKEHNWQFLQRFENIHYDPNAPIPKTFLRVLKEIQPDPEIRYWRILRPYAIVFDRTLIKRQCEIWMGRHDSGKTTLLKVLKRLASPYCSNIGLQTFTNRRDLFALAGLVDKVVNISGDLERIEIEDVGVLKELLGGDTMSIRRMHHEPVSVPIATKLFAACNGPPYIEKEHIWKDDAFWERFRVTRFDGNFTNVRDDTLTLDEGREEESKLLNQKEISGIFNILVGILRNVWLYKDYGFEFLPNESREAWRAALQASEKISSVINEKTYMNPNGSIPVDEFYHVINETLKKRGQGHVTRHDVNERMVKICNQSNDGRVRVWRGISWKDGNQLTLGGSELNGINGIEGHLRYMKLKTYSTIYGRKSVNSVNFFDIPLRSWFGQSGSRPTIPSTGSLKKDYSSTPDAPILPQEKVRTQPVEHREEKAPATEPPTVESPKPEVITPSVITDTSTETPKEDKSYPFTTVFGTWEGVNGSSQVRCDSCKVFTTANEKEFNEHLQKNCPGYCPDCKEPYGPKSGPKHHKEKHGREWNGSQFVQVSKPDPDRIVPSVLALSTFKKLGSQVSRLDYVKAICGYGYTESRARESLDEMWNAGVVEEVSEGVFRKS